MNTATEHHRRERDLRLPDHMNTPQQSRGFIHMLGRVVSGGVGIVIGAVYLIGAPIVALATGVGQIVAEVRENAARPRPFVGRAHGFPFLDPPPNQIVVPHEEEHSC